MFTQLIEYKLDNLVMEGFFAVDYEIEPTRGLIIIVHDWTGNREFAQEKARYFAKQGFSAFAVDLYGKGKRGSDTDKSINQALLSDLMANRDIIVPRLDIGIECAKSLKKIDSDKVMLIGFCMGGLCVLDFARSGANVAGVVSVHGLLQPPEITKNAQIMAKILVLHGYKDRSVSHQQILEFESEMTKRNADWQMHIFSDTYHSFTNPKANDLASGLLYNQLSNTRTWNLVRGFTNELFV